jgi:DNA-binding NarL/FixJ family response regulator
MPLSKAKPTLLIADDHMVVLTGLQSLLQNEYNIVGTVTDGESLVQEALKLKPELMIVDVSMPGLNGIEAVIKIRKAGLEPKVVFLTMHIDVTYAGRALEAGATGFVLKHEAPQKILEALQAARNGQRFLSAEIKQALEGITKCDSEKAIPMLGRLTLRQHEVLKLLCEGRSAKEIASKLGVSPRTAEFHKYRIMEILSVNTNAELVAYAMRHGLI